MTERDLPGSSIDTGPDPLPRHPAAPPWARWMVAFALILAACSILLSAILFSRTTTLAEQHRALTARTTLSNCRQIEVIKDQIRGTVAASIARLPTIAYYRRHPAELAMAVHDAQRSVARFAPVNCGRLPVVRSTPAP